MANYTSTQNGAWHVPATWGGIGVPGDGDTATIRHNVYIDSDITVGTGASGSTVYAIVVDTGGLLRWANPPSGNWTLTLKGGINIKKGGVFRIGESSAPLPASKTATVRFLATSSTAAWRFYIESGEMYLYGAPAYHMANVDSWRAKLTTDIIPANPGTPQSIQFSVDANVDWQVGDIISVGVGGNKDVNLSDTTMLQERVVITDKLSANTYVATFSYIHHAGSHVAHHTRNIVIQGNPSVAGCGFNIYLYRTENYDETGLRVWLSWARLYYGGWSSTASFIYGSLSSTGKITRHPNYLMLDFCVFDESANTSSGKPANSAIYITAYHIDRESENWCNSCVFYYTDTVFLFYDSHTLHAKKLVIQGCAAVCKISNGSGFFVLEDLWAGQWKATSISAYFFESSVSLSNFELYGCSCISSSFGNGQAQVKYFKNGKIYHFGSIIATDCVGITIFDSVEFYNIISNGLMLRASSLTLINNCSFDKYRGSTSYGPITVAAGTLRLSNCTFGTQSRNLYRNVIRNTASSPIKLARICAEKCTFVEPQSWSASYSYYRKTQAFSFWFSNGDWRDFAENGGYTASVELADCSVLNVSGGNQILLDYGINARRVFWVQGCDVVHEITNVIDGTVGVKVYSFSPGGEAALNLHRPLMFPVVVGQQVEVKISVYKTKDAYWVPRVVLIGCGIYAEKSATRGVTGTWEELKVSGTAQGSGICFVLFFMGSNNKLTASSNSNNVFYGPNAAPNWSDVYVYFDKLSVRVS